MDYLHHYRSPLGDITMASDGESLIGLWFDGQKHFADTLSRERTEASLPVFDLTDAWLDLYFSGQQPDFLPPLNPRGSAFRRVVWEMLMAIPYGQTVTYGALATRFAGQFGRSGMSAQAVGGAVGHNPISILIPCHRVMGADGSLTGYAGGTERKRQLLELEGVWKNSH